MRNSPQQGPRGPRGHRPREGRGRRPNRPTEGRRQGPRAQARGNRRNRPFERGSDNDHSPRRRRNRQRPAQAGFRSRHPFFNRRFDSRRGRGGKGKSVWNPPIELTVLEDRFEVLFELPGVSQDSINISVTDRLLKVKGEKERKQTDENHKFRRSELRYGKFRRMLPLPPHANADGIKAEFKDGVLSIVIPKSEDAKPTEIPINVES